MGSLCEGSEEKIHNDKVNIEEISLYIVMSFVSLCAIVAIWASIFIMCKKSSDERPLFVTL